MKTLEKLKVIDSLPTEGVIISPVGNQSFKVEHSCGCYFVQHGLARTPNVNPDRNKEKYDILYIDRTFFVELCKNHGNSIHNSYK
jgi:hypothetical protein